MVFVLHLRGLSPGADMDGMAEGDDKGLTGGDDGRVAGGGTFRFSFCLRGK